MVITATAPPPGPTVLQLWGPVRVECGDRVVEPGGPRERTVLAALALAQGRPVSVDRLLEWLWDEQPPPSARKSVQNAVLRLRQRLATAGVAVERVGDGYRLVLGEARVAGPGVGASLEQTVDSALRDAARARLEEARLTAVEHRVAALLELDADAAVAELERLVDEQPVREPLWALLVLAQYRAGRTAEALTAYARARRSLTDALGVEPGPVLRALHRSVLDHDPQLLAEQAAVGRALVADAAARAALGDVAGARSRYAEAVVAARRADDALLLADAAAGQAGEAQWVLGDTELEALLEQVVVRLGDPPSDRVRAGRAVAGLALLRAFRGDVRARAHAIHARALTAEGATPATRTAALFAAATAWEGPDDSELRDRHGRALLDHGRAAGDRTAQALGEQYLAWAALERGDAVTAAAARSRMLALAEDESSPHLAAQVANTHFLEALLAGRLDEAASRADELSAAWRAASDPGIAMVVEVGARTLLGELTGDLDPLLPSFGGLAAALPSDLMWPLSTALAHALAGRLDLAREPLSVLTPSDLRALPRSTLWIANLTGICQLAALCHRPELAELVLEQLRPLTGTQVVVAGLAYRGSVAHWQGLALHTLGRLDEAEATLRTALQQHRAVDSPPWVAQTELALAAVLLARAAEPDEVRALLTRARGAAEGMGMSVLAHRCAALSG